MIPLTLSCRTCSFSAFVSSRCSPVPVKFLGRHLHRIPKLVTRNKTELYTDSRHKNSIFDRSHPSNDPQKEFQSKHVLCTAHSVSVIVLWFGWSIKIICTMNQCLSKQHTVYVQVLFVSNRADVVRWRYEVCCNIVQRKNSNAVLATSKEKIFKLSCGPLLRVLCCVVKRSP